jgi:transcriptional regulator with XRE-family HTH domain
MVSNDGAARSLAADHLRLGRQARHIVQLAAQRLRAPGDEPDARLATFCCLVQHSVAFGNSMLQNGEQWSEEASMQQADERREELRGLGRRLAATRRERGLSQAELAKRCRLNRQQITYFERGQRLPSLDQLLWIAEALEAPLQRFLSGTDLPETGLRATALELRSLGLADLWVERPQVPGAFRRREEVVALAVAGEEPEARVVEGIPAVLAWNLWSATLLKAYGSTTGARTVYRLAWLAEVALTLERMGGFPGGCPGRQALATFVRRVKTPPLRRWDSLGRPGLEPPTSPVWKRWRINCAADLAAFRARAEALLALRRAEGSWPSSTGGVKDAAE